jgi:uncharacterized protein (TIGR00304 family)
VLRLLIFCISEACWLCLFKTLFQLSLLVGGKSVDPTFFYVIGIALVAVGVIIILTVIVFASIGAKKCKVRGAGVIMIGPIPIIFGADKKSVKSMLTFALSFTIVVLIITVVYYWLVR